MSKRYQMASNFRSFSIWVIALRRENPTAVHSFKPNILKSITFLNTNWTWIYLKILRFCFYLPAFDVRIARYLWEFFSHFFGYGTSDFRVIEGIDSLFRFFCFDKKLTHIIEPVKISALTLTLAASASKLQKAKIKIKNMKIAFIFLLVSVV